MEEQLRLLRQQLAGLTTEDNAPPREKVLEPLNLEGVAKHIQKIKSSDDKRKIVVMTGAGISTAAGIPDFRSPGTGLYDNLQKYDLPNPQAIFEIGYFRQNPRPFYHLAKELYPAKFKPTLSHYFIRLLAEEGLLMRNFTQNIDTLERRAGLPDELIVEAHGAFHNAHCITCNKEYSHDFVKELVFVDKLPLCTEPGCAYTPDNDLEEYKGLVKPDIVFFGESLPDRFAHCARQDMSKCELLIIMGTSLVVHPFASLKDMVSDGCPRLLINLERAGEMDPIMILFGQSGGMDFNEGTAYRDVFHGSTCDDGCQELAHLLGLGDKLKALHESEHQRLDVEVTAIEAALAKISTKGYATGEVDRSKSTDQSGASKEGDQSASSKEGNQSGASKEGDQSASSKEGNQSASSKEGKQVAVVTTTVIGKPEWGEADTAASEEGVRKGGADRTDKEDSLCVEGKDKEQCGGENSKR